MSLVDVAIVGSGFGGAVMAARLGAHLATGAAGARRVLVLERGDDHTGRFDARSDGGPLNAQGNRFRHTLDPAYLTRVAELFTDREAASHGGAPSMNVIAGRGVGGGSNVYCGVSLRAPTTSFEQVRDARRLWPAIYTRAALDPYYAIVERELSVHRMQWTGAPHWQLAGKRDLVFAEGCRRIGATAAPLKLACDADRNEGWWSSGQRFAGRSDLTTNYLAKALAAGVEFRTGHDVATIARSGRGYVIEGVDGRGGARAPFAIECKLLFIAAGAVASTGILLRSNDAFGGSLDPARLLGKEVSANGDYGVTGSVGPGLAVEGFKGKPMSSFCPSFWREHRFLLIPFYTEPLWLALGQPAAALRAKDPAATGRAVTEEAGGERAWGLVYKQRLRTFGERMLTMGCLAIDDGEGEIVLGRNDRADVRWRETSRETEARWSTAVTKMRAIYEALGGEMYLDGYRRHGTVSTAHPLGGCRMASRADPRGVVDENGESFANENLFVVDGAAIPSALGTNPSLTIAAVAESIADRLVRGVGTKGIAARLAS